MATTAANGDKEPRTERGRKTLRRLIEAAAAEFGERGFHEAAITGITRRAGVALGTFYTYFESKESLFRAVVSDMSHQVRLYVAEAVKDAPDRIAAATGLTVDFPPPVLGTRPPSRPGSRSPSGTGRRCCPR